MSSTTTPRGPVSGGALLSPEDSGTRAHPLRHWGIAARERFEAEIDGALGEWRAAWGLEDRWQCGHARCSDWSDACQSGWTADWDTAASGVWYGAGSTRAERAGARSALRELAHALLGDGAGLCGVPADGRAEAPDRRGTIAEELVLSAWADLGRRVSGRLQPEAGLAPHAVLSLAEAELPWSGAMVARAPFGGSEIRILVAGAVLGRLVGPVKVKRPERRREPVVSIWSAAGRSRVAVQVQLQPFEIELGGLLSLEAGDVLGSSHRVEEPLAVHCLGLETEGEAPMCLGYLGRLTRWRALELALAEPPRTNAVKEQESTMGSNSPPDLAAKPLSLIELGATQAEGGDAPAVPAGTELANPLRNVRVKVTVSLGGAELTIGELLGAKVEQVLRLDQAIDEPVDVRLEGQVVARGTLVAVDGRFGVRITELPKALELPLDGPRKA